LNLHATCRLVINLELPWNPIRLEQRIGRVDRIGQTRTVHAINLFAAGTAEGDVLARLQQRLASIRMSEIELAACVITRSEPAQRQSAEHTCTSVAEMRGSADAEAQRMAMARTRVASHADMPEGVIPVTCLRRQRLRAVDGLRHCLVAFMRVRLVTLAGRLIEDTLVPVRVPFQSGTRRTTRSDIRITATAALATIHPHLVRVAREHAELRSKVLETESAQWSLGAIARERQIARNAASLPGTLVQAGLFDTRAVTAHLEGQKRHDALQIESHTHANLREADTRICLRHDPDVALLVISC
jgi:superfamily II DNA/RNA helicase